MNVEELTRDLEILRKIVARHTELNSAGYGRCPFHEESTPSFNIFAAKSGKARYNCFGCGETGDVIDFARKKTGCGFNDAIRQIGNIIAQPVLPSLGSGERTLNIEINGFCERDCQKYINLREDYNVILEENYNLKGTLFVILDLHLNHPDEIKRLIVKELGLT